MMRVNGRGVSVVCEECGGEWVYPEGTTEGQAALHAASKGWSVDPEDGLAGHTFCPSDAPTVVRVADEADTVDFVLPVGA